MSLWKTGSYSYPFLATQWNFHVEQNIGLIFRYYTKAFQNIEGIQQGNWTTECIHKGKRKVSFFLPANTAFHWNVGTKLTLCLAKTLNAIKKKNAASFWFPFSLNYFITHIYKLSTWKDSCVHTIEKHKNIKASASTQFYLLFDPDLPICSLVTLSLLFTFFVDCASSAKASACNLRQVRLRTTQKRGEKQRHSFFLKWENKEYPFPISKSCG